MADVDAEKIDIIVVYKVDRLTRALADFAKIIDRLDAKAASFVSVTQAFNTTSSMGRLTLNVLLSFAQFEREVTGERIRDKIAASKAKGMWMGGNLPLGYETPLDNQYRTLVIHSEEAKLVRHIFERYLALGSVHVLERELAVDGYRSKLQIAKNGNRRGDVVLSRGALFHLLKNPVYRGKITHKGKIYPGRHPAIIDEALFEAVQKQIGANAVSHKTWPVRQGAAPLRGLIFDASGSPMSPSFGYGRRGKAYRYYVSSALMAGRTPPPDHISRVPAEALEDLVSDRLDRLGLTEAQDALASLLRVEVHPMSLHLVLDRAKALTMKPVRDWSA